MARNVFTIRLVMLLVSLAYLTSCSVEVREPPKYVANEQLEKIEGKKEDVDRGTAAVDKFQPDVGSRRLVR